MMERDKSAIGSDTAEEFVFESIDCQYKLIKMKGQGLEKGTKHRENSFDSFDSQKITCDI